MPGTSPRQEWCQPAATLLRLQLRRLGDTKRGCVGLKRCARVCARALEREKRARSNHCLGFFSLSPLLCLGSFTCYIHSRSHIPANVFALRERERERERSSTGHTCTPLHFSRVYNVVTQTCFAGLDKKNWCVWKNNNIGCISSSNNSSSSSGQQNSWSLSKVQQKIGFKTEAKKYRPIFFGYKIRTDLVFEKNWRVEFIKSETVFFLDGVSAWKFRCSRRWLIASVATFCSSDRKEKVSLKFSSGDIDQVFDSRRTDLSKFVIHINIFARCQLI